MSQYIVLFEDTNVFRRVEGWDEIRKILRDAGGRPLTIYPEAAKFTEADHAKEEAVFALDNPDRTA